MRELLLMIGICCVWLIRGGCVFSQVSVGDLICMNGSLTNLSDGLHFNPYLVNTSYPAFRKSPITEETWRLQFLAKIDSCKGAPFPVSIDSGFNVLIANESFFPHISISYFPSTFMQLSINNTVAASGINPGSWFPVDGSVCGKTYDTIVDYNGTHLRVLFDYNIPWLVYPINITSHLKGKLVVGWYFSVGSMISDLVLTNITLTNCTTNPQIRSKKCTSSRLPDYSPSFSIYNEPASGTTTFSNGVLHMATNYWTAAWVDTMVDVRSSWNVSFDLYVHNCVSWNNCYGDGFAFVIQNEAAALLFAGGGGGGLGFKSPTNQNSVGITFDFFKLCQGTSFIRKESYTPLFQESTDIYKPNQNFPCPSSYQVMIQYNTTHFTLSMNQTELFIVSFPYNISDLILTDGRRGYIGWTLGDASAKMEITLSNIVISQYLTECYYEDPFPFPAPSPPPPQVPSSSPSSSPPLVSPSPSLSPSPESLTQPSTLINVICSPKCEMITNHTVTLQNETFFLSNTILNHISITINSKIIYSQGNLSIESSSLHLNTITFISMASGLLNIKNSDIYLDNESTLLSSGHIQLQNITFHIPTQHPNDIILIQSNTSLEASSISIAPTQDCYNIQFTKSAIALHFTPCSQLGELAGIIVGCVIGGVVVIGVTIYVYLKCSYQKELSNLKLNVRNTISDL